MKRMITTLAAAILAASMVTSCGKTGKTGHKWKNSDTLNEWQIDLLESQGLPTDIDQLTSSKKRSIQHIYEMISYLNDKYDEEFVYAGYIEPGLMEEERLFAYPKQYGADGGRNTVEVTVDDDGNFTDNYSSIEIRDYCEKLYNDFIRDYFNSDKAIAIIANFDCKIQNVNEIKNNRFKNKVGGANQIFISDEICNKTEFDKFVADYYHWCDKCELHGNNRITLIHIDNFELLTSKNYTDFYEKKYIVSDETLCLFGNHKYSSTLDKAFD